MIVALGRIARARGRLSEAHRFDARADSIYADFLRAARFDPVFDRPVSLAAEELWLRQRPSQAVSRLDSVFAAHPVRSLTQIQDRMDAVRAAALYAAAGRPERARSVVNAIMATSDANAQRAIQPLRSAALAEIALAEDRPREAMAMFRESDRAADDTRIGAELRIPRHDVISAFCPDWRVQPNGRVGRTRLGRTGNGTSRHQRSIGWRRTSGFSRWAIAGSAGCTPAWETAPKAITIARSSRSYGEAPTPIFSGTLGCLDWCSSGPNAEVRSA